MNHKSYVVKTLPERCGQDIVAAKISYGYLSQPIILILTLREKALYVRYSPSKSFTMEIKEYEYPCVVVEEFSDGNSKGIDPYHEDTQACRRFQLCCFIPGKRRKDIQNDCCTTVEVLDDDLVLANILVDPKKECHCMGKIVGDGKLGRMIQLEGDRELQVKDFLGRQGLAKD